MKMKERNGQLKSALGAMATKERIVEVQNLPKEDTVNICGHAAYSLDDELRLITMLNTLKVEPQFYRSENKIMQELRDLIERIGLKDPYFVAQAIVYSRCMGEGMRTINHLAAALLAPFIAGQDYSKRFYGAFDKKNQKGGCIFRLDDMTEIKDVWAALNTVNVNGREKMMALPNAMKKGFASVIENADANLLAKYKKTVIDIANLVHANVKNSRATVKLNDEDFLAYKNACEAYAKRHNTGITLTTNVVKVLDAIMKGITVQADTWETANSEAGQEVAKAVREGKINKAEAERILAEAKADNWEALLTEGKLGMLAALRNIRNIMKNPRKNIIDAWCKMITDGEKARKSLILPIHFDLAYEVVMDEFAQADYSPQVQQALLTGYENAIPNLKSALPGRTCIIVDCSGSMGSCSINIAGSNARPESYWYGYRGRDTKRCSYKAGLIAATIAKATDADVIKFGDSAYRFTYDKHANVFAMAKTIGTATDGCTNAAAAFELLRRERAVYDRIVFISDNAINGRVNTSTAYSNYIHDVCSPYIYAVDLAAYGTTPLKNVDKVNYYFGYGSMLYEDIASKEFNPAMHIEKIRKVVI